MMQLALQVGQTAQPEAILFWVLAPLAVLAALGMLLVKKAVHSAILMAFVMIVLAIFYIAQDAVFLGIVQVVVYTGAVMMLFLFILMLVGVDSSDSLTETIRGLRPIAITAAIGFGGLLVSLLGRATIGRNAVGLSAANADGNVQALAQLLFSTYVWPFEVVSALLITAALGAMVLAHHHNTQVRPTQRRLSINRFRGDSLGSAAGLPGPGVYARHNAVDVPALLPDGTPAPTSVNASLEARGDMLDYKKFDLAEVNTQVEEEK
ncbi:MAG: NADH-quinone oxidoreductase subunit J [Actinobacteria bacterium]|nr:NADH-quinone oxidoreductase subunit J [Actinomycetota bacterium]